MRVVIKRVKMIGGGNSYDALVPVEDVPGYDGARYTTVISTDDRRYVEFVPATLPESHFRMPTGWERYEDFLAHEKAAKAEALILLKRLYPETRNLEKFPLLWVEGLNEPHDSRETTR